MVVVQIWGTPTACDKKRLNRLRDRLRNVIGKQRDVKRLTHHSEVFFPQDLVHHGRETDAILVQMMGNFDDVLWGRLLKHVDRIINQYFPRNSRYLMVNGDVRRATHPGTSRGAW